MIKYDIASPSNVKISIYDMQGREVATLLDQFKTPGYWNLHWSGVNKLGNEVPSGMYLYTIETENYRSTKKMILIQNI